MPDAYNPWGAPVFPTAADNAMQPETFVPQGVRDWTQQAAPKDYNILSQIAGSLGKALMYPGQVAQSQTPISTEDMVGPAFNLAGMLTLGAGAAPQEANALNMGIKAYHGSPHDFDKFDLSKIGTGEGAQAYGHGLYFADKEGVAKSYRDALAQTVTADGQPILANNKIVGSTGNKNVDDMLIAHNGDLESAIADLKSHMAGLTPGQLARAGHEPELASLEALRGKVDSRNNGHMYEVNINADPSHFLDWDKPLTEQSPHVQDILQNDLYLGLIPKETGRDAYNQARPLSASEDMARPLASQKLREAGIPGIKYLDQGSRSPTPFKISYEPRPDADRFHVYDDKNVHHGVFPTREEAQKVLDAKNEASQSRNYVVFNHDLIDIMRKYAVPGMLGAPILANALSEQKT